MSTDTYKNEVIHPGEYIKQKLEERGWTQKDLAFILGCREPHVTTLITGKRGTNAELAKAFENIFGDEAAKFSNLQRDYDLARAPSLDSGIKKRSHIQSKYPIGQMIKRGWIEGGDVSALESQLTRFFEVPNIDHDPHMTHAAKKTNYQEASSEQLAWLFRVKQIANSIIVPEYSEQMLKKALLKLKELLVDPESLREVPRILGECGVRLILVESLAGSKIDGACLWVKNNTSPIIGMSLRHDRIDNSWFVLRHEIEHVLCKHAQDGPIIDVDIFENIDNISEEERIANSAAADFCVPTAEMNSFVARKFPFFSDKDIQAFAKIMQVHPGLVVGQLHHKTKKYTLFRKYLARVRQYILQGATKDGWGQIYPVQI